MNATKCGFLQGYACCLQAMLAMEGCANTQHREAYAACFGAMTEKEMQLAGIEQSDIDIFKKDGLLKT